MRSTTPLRWHALVLLAALSSFISIVYILSFSTIYDDTKKTILVCYLSVMESWQHIRSLSQKERISSFYGNYKKHDDTRLHITIDKIKVIFERISISYQQFMNHISNYSRRLVNIHHVKKSNRKERRSQRECQSKASEFHEQKQIYEKRSIGRACDPQIGIEVIQSGDMLAYDKEDDKIANNKKINEPFPGMMLQIFSPQFDEDIIQRTYALDADHYHQTTSSIEVRSSSGMIKTEPIKSSQNYNLPCIDLSLSEYINEYELIDILHNRLGKTDLHNQDYAYRPVAKLTDESTKFSNVWLWGESGSEYDYARMGERAFAGGSHGEVWKARRRCNQVDRYRKTKNSIDTDHFHRHAKNTCDDTQDLILKRMKIGKDDALLEAGLREVYFGDILSRSDSSSSLFTMYIDHFFLHESYKSTSDELWIVFENAGPSLRSYIYTPVTTGHFIVYQHSSRWRQWRMDLTMTMASSNSSSMEVFIDKSSFPQKTFTGNLHNKILKANGHVDNNSPRMKAIDLLKEILHQILTSASKLHERGIIHRDIKPSNIMCSKDSNNGINCVLGDFSSAYDEFSSEHFYSKGPSAAEQTNEYAPPEVLFAKHWRPFFSAKPESYDSWSIGVVILELLLGTPNVFSVDQRTTTLLSNKMKKEGANEEDVQRALYLAALSQFCIYIPTDEANKNWPLREGDPLFKASIVKKTCTMNDFHSALRARDPLGIGFDRSMDPLLHLIWELLAWDPKDRLTATEALEHFYFTNRNQYSDEDQNALEPQMLDPRVDMDIEKRKIDSFVCPKCGRIFTDLRSCQAHATGRKHAKFCNYDRSLLPPCLNAHSMLPSHPTSGYCDIQGRRKVIEDFHTVHLEQGHQFFGIFDGHNGNLASKYAASELYKQFIRRLGDLDDDIASGDDWKKEVEIEMKESFEALHRGVLDVIQSYPAGAVMSKSGTTATALFVTDHAVVVASVGDSRAILSVGTSYDPKKQASSIQLTVDHVAVDSNERMQIEQRGGVVSSRGGVLRVNGTLVLSRSIGDAHLAKYLSRTPNVVAMTKEEVREKCKLSKEEDAYNTTIMPCFIILASDGLWDVIENQEAVDLVEQVIQKYHIIHESGWEGGAFQEAAELLTQEAYVRGSTDNIGVCVVAIT